MEVLNHVYWQQKNFDRKQRDSESLYEFSHALMALMDKVKQCKVDSMFNVDIVLRDQFCENVRDPMLRRELKRFVRGNEALSLLDVRREAIRWVEEGQPNREKHVQPQPQMYETRISTGCEAIEVKPSQEFIELRDMVLRQQAQLDLLAKHLGPVENIASRPAVKTNRFRRSPDGQPICIRCNVPGHIARYCGATLPPSNPQVNNSGLNGAPASQAEN